MGITITIPWLVLDTSHVALPSARQYCSTWQYAHNLGNTAGLDNGLFPYRVYFPSPLTCNPSLLYINSDGSDLYAKSRTHHRDKIFTKMDIIMTNFHRCYRSRSRQVYGASYPREPW